MTNRLHAALFAALSKLLRPLVRVFLRNGLAYGQFAEIVKQVFVDVAYQEFQPKHRKQSDAHVAVVTGLTRKEVRRLRQIEKGEDSAALEKYNRATRVISAWLNDPRFQDGKGGAAILPLEGHDNSFSELVRAYSGDMKTISMLSALEQAGTVRRENDRVRLIKHAYVPGSDPIEKINILGNDCNELLSTIDHNLVAPPDQLRFQRKASNTRIDASQAALIHEMLKVKGQALLEVIDTKMTDIENDFQDSTNTRTVSVGIYFYESTDPGKTA